MGTIDPKVFYAPAELAKLLGVGRKSIAIACADGRIPSKRFNRKTLILGQNAIDFFAGNNHKRPGRNPLDPRGGE